jgi:hypothetical protein
MFSSNASQVSNNVKYIEDVFSTWLRTGTGSSTTITTGLDASTNKALVWTKSRSAATDHKLTDTVRGATKALISNTTGAQTTDTNGLTAFSSTGYTIGSDANYNNSGATYVDWEFVATPKFFDVVTYTGTGSNTTIAHNLGSVPGCIIVKRTDTTGAWQVYHRSLANTQYMVLNTTAAVATGATRWNSTTPTDTVFSVGTDAAVNASGGTYVAYLFAHDSGGFGLTGTDNVISCGSLTTNGSGVSTVNLGYEPQWVLLKAYAGTNPTSQWFMYDNMRGWTNPANNARLYANLSNAETSGDGQAFPTATGFGSGGLGASTSYIYIAIRRGPMKVPTTGTSVFSPIAATASTNTDRTTNFPIDLQILCQRDKANYTDTWAVDRLRGVSTTTTASGRYLITNSTNAEQTANAITLNFGSTGFQDPFIFDTLPMVWWNFRRAPSFFDEVCYTGTGSATTVAHNLAAVPELIIIKNRGTAGWGWYTFSPTYLTSPSAITYRNYLELQSTNAAGDWGNNGALSAAPTSSVLNLGFVGGAATNGSGSTYVAYLFATCAGVSKVGSYTGTGATQTIDCGFTGGARFVLVKRTDSTGDWYVWDTARGMVSGTDPSLLLNSTAAEVNANSIYTTTGGFQIVSTAAGINASGGSYIYFSVA